MEVKRKKLIYRRAIWEKGKAQNNLQTLLTEAHEEFITTQDRTFPYSGGEIQGVDIDLRREGCFSCQVTYYFPHQEASLVPYPSTSPSNEIGTLPPPKKNNYLEGDIFFMVKNNDIVMCPSNVRESVAIEYIKQMLVKKCGDQIALQYSIEPAANINKVRLLQRERVKKIELNSSLYEAAVRHEERTSIKKKLVGRIVDELKAIFLHDEDDELRNISDKENISVKLELSFDSRKRDGHLGSKRMLKLGEQVVGDDHGFTIKTTKGNSITSNDLRLHKDVNIAVKGNSISKESAFDALTQYLKELINSGLTVQ